MGVGGVLLWSFFPGVKIFYFSNFHEVKILTQGKKKIPEVHFLGRYPVFFVAKKMENEKDPWGKLFSDLMAFEILENRLKCCKACYCVGIDTDGTPFRVIHGNQAELAELLDVEQRDDPKVTE